MGVARVRTCARCLTSHLSWSTSNFKRARRHCEVGPVYSVIVYTIVFLRLAFFQLPLRLLLRHAIVCVSSPSCSNVHSVRVRRARLLLDTGLGPSRA